MMIKQIQIIIYIKIRHQFEKKKRCNEINPVGWFFMVLGRLTSASCIFDPVF